MSRIILNSIVRLICLPLTERFLWKKPSSSSNGKVIW